MAHDILDVHDIRSWPRPPCWQVYEEVTDMGVLQVYEEVTDMGVLRKLMDDYLEACLRSP